MRFVTTVWFYFADCMACRYNKVRAPGDTCTSCQAKAGK